MVSVETVVTATGLAIAFGLPRVASGWFRAVENRLGRIARRRWLAVLLVGALSFGGSAAVSLLGQMPVPAVHDEFSYLLAADTFAAGRWSNPTHPLWVHFESFHIIQHPTYASKYPPGQGLVLAVGQGLFGHSMVGVWLGMGLACAAITWMLQAWLPPWWALLGGLLVAVRLGIFSYWSQSYWGGAVAAIGGALVWGALRRVVHRPKVWDALLVGLGVAILANSRPYEGLLVSLPAAAALLVWMGRKAGPSVRVTIKRIVLPVCAVLALTAGAMGFYNKTVTGDLLRMPYQVHEGTYSVAPLFLWQRLRPKPTYRHKTFDDFHVSKLAREFTEQQSLTGLLRYKGPRLKGLLRFYLWPELVIPLVMLPWVLRDWWMRLALLTCGVLLAGLLAESPLQVHYAAPITGLLFALALQGMRHLHVWRWRGRRTGRFIVWAIVGICVVSAPQLLEKPKTWSLDRASFLALLSKDVDRHLVVVRYRPWHNANREWVYNEADIDAAKVVWAREMDPAQNRKLLEYFKDRRAWLLFADAEPPGLMPYPVESDQ
jgi:hypothetical protein